MNIEARLKQTQSLADYDEAGLSMLWAEADRVFRRLALATARIDDAVDRAKYDAERLAALVIRSRVEFEWWMRGDDHVEPIPLCRIPDIVFD